MAVVITVMNGETKPGETGANMAYHYTESGLRNVYLENGYTIRKTPYGETVSIQDVDGLHRAIGTALAKKARLTGADLRFLRKELGLSQGALAIKVGASEEDVSLWEGDVGKPSLAAVYRVATQWDAEAGVWVATSEDVPGLVTEAETAEALMEKLRGLVPELLELNAKR